VAGSRRIIAWLRGDPRGLRVARQHREILEAQSILLIYPSPERLVDADVIVAPLPGSPEEPLYRTILDEYPGPIVRERDPHAALSRSLSYPKDRFTRLIIGVDPGRECGIAAIADGIVINLSKRPCNDLAPTVMELAGLYPSARVETYIGDGYGLAAATVSMDEHGLRYVIVDEHGTTRPPSYAGLFSLVRDKDLLAGLAIALKGAYGSGRIAHPLR